MHITSLVLLQLVQVRAVVTVQNRVVIVMEVVVVLVVVVVVVVVDMGVTMVVVQLVAVQAMVEEEVVVFEVRSAHLNVKAAVNREIEIVIETKIEKEEK